MELIDKTKLLQYKTLVQQHLSDPVKLRLITIGLLLIIGVGAVYMPLSKHIREQTVLLSAEKERNNDIADVEKLREQVGLIRGKIGATADNNAWAQCILDGLRGFGVKLRGMESKQPLKVGPYRAIVLLIEIEGPYSELKGFVEWLETSERLLRIDSISFAKGSKSLVIKLRVLGVVNKNA